MSRALFPLLILTFATTLSFSAAAAQETSTVDFAKDLAPIFRDRCLSCHAESANGGLQLTSVDAWTHGGDSGAVFSAGDPENSLIWQLITQTDDDRKMPPEGSRLNSEQLRKIRLWLTEGAVWPKDVVLTSPRTAAREHWAFQPVIRPTVPSVENADQLKNAIDGFVISRLNELNIAIA